MFYVLSSILNNAVLFDLLVKSITHSNFVKFGLQLCNGTKPLFQRLVNSSATLTHISKSLTQELLLCHHAALVAGPAVHVDCRVHQVELLQPGRRAQQAAKVCVVHYVAILVPRHLLVDQRCESGFRAVSSDKVSK